MSIKSPLYHMNSNREYEYEENMNVAIGIINNGVNREGGSGSNRPLLKEWYTNYNY